MACSSSCRTKDHLSFGDCIRSKNVRVDVIVGEDRLKQKKADSTLDKYESARRSGIQPKSTRPFDVEFATRISDKTGSAYQAV